MDQEDPQVDQELQYQLDQELQNQEVQQEVVTLHSVPQMRIAVAAAVAAASATMVAASDPVPRTMNVGR